MGVPQEEAPGVWEREDPGGGVAVSGPKLDTPDILGFGYKESGGLSGTSSRRSNLRLPCDRLVTVWNGEFGRDSGGEMCGGEVF